MSWEPGLFNIAGFGAAVATMWAAAGAWFTFFASEKSSRERDQNSVQSVLDGIEAELSLIEPWAQGGKGDQGFLRSVPTSQLQRENKDWFNPSRVIVRFYLPGLQAFVTSGQVSRLSAIAPALVRLSFSINRLFDLHNELRALAHGEPSLYRSVFTEFLSRPLKDFPPEEQQYMNMIFELNLRIHRNLIGGDDSEDIYCLYKTFRAARCAVADFKRRSPAAFPSWYRVMHTAAASMAILGAICVTWCVLCIFRG